jgi:hypothetical protein
MSCQSEEDAVQVWNERYISKEPVDSASTENWQEMLWGMLKEFNDLKAKIGDFEKGYGGIERAGRFVF